MLGFAPCPEDLRFWDCVDKGTLFIFSCFQERTHNNQPFPSMELFLASLCAGPLNTYHGGLCCEQLGRNLWCFGERLVKGTAGPQ